MRLNDDSLILKKYSKALLDGICQKMSEDERVFLFGLDVDDHKGIQGSTLGLVDQFGTQRCFSTPLSEDAMTGVAIGAAMAGLRPIHVHIRMDFLLLCMNQLVNMAAKMHYTTAGAFSVPLVVRAMIGRSWGQGAQHSQALHSLFCHIPGLKVVAPSNAHDAQGLMVASIEDENPVIFIEHRLLYNVETLVPKSRFSVPIGKARVVREGTDITIVCISHMMLEGMRAASALEKIGISVEVIDPVTLSPLDVETISTSAIKTGKLLVVDNAWTNCGVAAEILISVNERCLALGNEHSVKLSRMGFANTVCPTTHNLEDEFYPTPETISHNILSMLGAGKHEVPAGLFDEPNRTELASFKGPF